MVHGEWISPTAVVEKLGGTGTSDMDREGTSRWRSEKLCEVKTCPASCRGGRHGRSHDKGQYTWVRTDCAQWQFNQKCPGQGPEVCEADDGTYPILHRCGRNGRETTCLSATRPSW